MSTHIDVFPGPGPFQVNHQPENECAVIKLEGAAHLSLFLNSVAETDALIAAATEAKRLLTGAQAGQS